MNQSGVIFESAKEKRGSGSDSFIFEYFLKFKFDAISNGMLSISVRPYPSPATASTGTLITLEFCSDLRLAQIRLN